MKLTESEKRAARAALEALREACLTSTQEDWCNNAIQHLDAQPTADEPAPGFVAWVTRDAVAFAGELYLECPRYDGEDAWRGATGELAAASLREHFADALLGDARGEKAIRRVRIVPDGSVGDE